MAKFAIVGFYLSINALLFIWLCFKVINVRRGEQISIGNGDNKKLHHRIRAQGNAAEYMPIFFLLMVGAASLSTPPLALHVFGAAFTVGRILHAYWFLSPSKNLKPRVAGMMLTLSSTSILAVGLLAHSVVIMAGGY
ncbi:MAG: MAPEG family protein [Hyphomicrobiales bacterium]